MKDLSLITRVKPPPGAEPERNRINRVDRRPVEI
jgi:hypothetical protein